MKTIAYNLQKEIITAILTLILTFAVLTTVKSQQSTSEPAPDSFSETVFQPSEAQNHHSESEADSHNFFQEMKNWMNTGAYWEPIDDNQPEKKNLSALMADWMKKGSYWKGNEDFENIEHDLYGYPVAEMENE